jgi:NhaP-type Na+/H+ or K+/H+ antiporter
MRLTDIAVFVPVCWALHRYGSLLSQLTQMPSITLCLLAGALCTLTGLLHAATAHSLMPVHQAALALITFAAGSHLEIESLRANRVVVKSLTLCFTWATLCVVGVVAFLMMPGSTNVQQAIVGSMLASVISIARSASSAIGVVSEERAAGPYTQTMLSVTMLTDAVVVVLFAAAVEVAGAALAEVPEPATLLTAHFVGRTALRLALSLAHAAVLAALCVLVLRLPAAPAPLRPCSLGLVAASAFATESGFHRLTRGTELASFVRLEPMLSCASRSHFSLSANFT